MQAIRQAIEALELKHGSLRAAARAVDMDVAYMWRLKQGVKRGPGDKTLRKLGLERSVTFKVRK